jgi:hypothetical protein
MFSILAFAVLCYIGYRHVHRRKRSVRGGPFGRPLFDTKTHAERRGEEGEANVDAHLRTVLSAMCGTDFYLHSGGLILHHARGTDFPTAELDHMAVTPFGIFVVETKNWAGHISPGDAPGTLSRTMADGAQQVRKSPDAQNRPKVGYLRGLVPGMWPVHGLGVFASPETTVDPALPLSLIHVSELAHWFRAKQHGFANSGEPPVNVELVKQLILRHADASAEALAEHRRRVRSEAAAS